MGLLSSSIRCIRYLSCAIDVFIKYTWVKPLKDEKGKTAFKAFMKIVNEFKCKRNKLWVDQRGEFKNILLQKW